MREPILILALASFACSTTSESPDAGGCFTGTEGAAPEMSVIYRTVTGTIAELVPGAPIPLIEPPQGGRVVFVGARARNLDGCPINIRSALYDPCDGRELTWESRDIVLKPAASGWLEPEFPDQIASYSNLAVCPNGTAERDLHDLGYDLEVRLTDLAGRTIRKLLPVRPICAEPGQLAECLCLCRAGYRLGPCPDAGTSSTACP